MRRIRKSAAVQRFDQAWELFCGLLPKAAPPIVADLRSRALLAAGVVQGQDMDDEQAICAEKFIGRLNGEIADYRRARHEVVGAFVRSVARGYGNVGSLTELHNNVSGAWRQSAVDAVKVLGASA